MASARMTNVYKIMKDANFDLENTINSEYFCTICNKLLINAHNAPCGCRYCLECVAAYLDGEEKYCPGNTDDCKIDLLNIDNNIHIDQPMNIKISRLIVKCPEGDCDESVELINLEDHFRVCNWRRTNCPFFNVGCRNVQMTNVMIEQHLLSDNHAHTKLLMDCIDVLRNEIGEMKGKELVIDELRADIAQQSREIDRLGEEMVEVGNLNRQTKAEIKELKEIVKGKEVVLDDLRAVVKQQFREIDRLGNVNKEITDKINGLATKMESYEAANLEMRNNGETQMNDKFEQMQLKGSDVDVKIGGLEKRVMAMAAQENHLNYYGEFVWPIDNFSEKRRKAQNGIETRLYSDEFFSHNNGYKMCLSVYPDGNRDVKGTHLSVYIHLIPGPFDDILEWPIKCEAIISIVNQQSRLDHCSDPFKSTDNIDHNNWKRPIAERNKGYGSPNLIRLDELLNNRALCANDRIFIRYAVRTF